ncbi:hypothetical protein CC78DRAFT_322624 [Lojkania enalia]|uniref:PHD-type domain-containing protein n=1 Tax=Lojkania enalia TaxID=147567 RepID=A0A9P4MYA9_9PLEO|nr:hypothetical protein CC78DRAFT_322624 [Didymosphaeria enalia]
MADLSKQPRPQLQPGAVNTPGHSQTTDQGLDKSNIENQHQKARPSRISLPLLKRQRPVSFEGSLSAGLANKNSLSSPPNKVRKSSHRSSPREQAKTSINIEEMATESAKILSQLRPSRSNSAGCNTSLNSIATPRTPSDASSRGNLVATSVLGKGSSRLQMELARAPSPLRTLYQPIEHFHIPDDDTASIISSVTRSERSVGSNDRSTQCRICGGRSAKNYDPFVQCPTCHRRFHEGCRKPALAEGVDLTSWKCFRCEKSKKVTKLSENPRTILRDYTVSRRPLALDSKSKIPELVIKERYQSKTFMKPSNTNEVAHTASTAIATTTGHANPKRMHSTSIAKATELSTEDKQQDDVRTDSPKSSATPKPVFTWLSARDGMPGVGGALMDEAALLASIQDDNLDKLVLDSSLPNIRSNKQNSIADLPKAFRIVIPDTPTQYSSQIHTETTGRRPAPSVVVGEALDSPLGQNECLPVDDKPEVSTHASRTQLCSVCQKIRILAKGRAREAICGECKNKQSLDIDGSMISIPETPKATPQQQAKAQNSTHDTEAQFPPSKLHSAKITTDQSFARRVPITSSFMIDVSQIRNEVSHSSRDQHGKEPRQVEKYIHQEACNFDSYEAPMVAEDVEGDPEMRQCTGNTALDEHKNLDNGSRTTVEAVNTKSRLQTASVLVYDKELFPQAQSIVSDDETSGPSAQPAAEVLESEADIQPSFGGMFVEEDKVEGSNLSEIADNTALNSPKALESNSAAEEGESFSPQAGSKAYSFRKNSQRVKAQLPLKQSAHNRLKQGTYTLRELFGFALVAGNGSPQIIGDIQNWVANTFPDKYIRGNGHWERNLYVTGYNSTDFRKHTESGKRKNCWEFSGPEARQRYEANYLQFCAHLSHTSPNPGGQSIPGPRLRKQASSRTQSNPSILSNSQDWSTTFSSMAQDCTSTLRETALKEYQNAVRYYKEARRQEREKLRDSSRPASKIAEAKRSLSELKQGFREWNESWSQNVRSLGIEQEAVCLAPEVSDIDGDDDFVMFESHRSSDANLDSDIRLEKRFFLAYPELIEPSIDTMTQEEIDKKIEEIKKRPSRKATFGKRLAFARTHRKNVHDEISDSWQAKFAALRKQTLPLPPKDDKERDKEAVTRQDVTKTVDLKELLNLPKNPIPIIYEGQLAFRDGTLVNGKLPPPSVVYKVGETSDEDITN